MGVIVKVVGIAGVVAQKHPAGVSYRETKKGRLLIYDNTGRELARYKSGQWNAVMIDAPAPADDEVTPSLVVDEISLEQPD